MTSKVVARTYEVFAGIPELSIEDSEILTMSDQVRAGNFDGRWNRPITSYQTFGSIKKDGKNILQGLPGRSQCPKSIQLEAQKYELEVQRYELKAQKSVLDAKWCLLEAQRSVLEAQRS